MHTPCHNDHTTRIPYYVLVDVPPSTLGKVRIIRGYVSFLCGFLSEWSVVREHPPGSFQLSGIHYSKFGHLLGWSLGIGIGIGIDRVLYTYIKC